MMSQLEGRPLRYNELAQEIRRTRSDLTDGVLSKNLKRLSASGLIHQEPTGDGYHVYSLTERGRDATVAIRRLAGSGVEPPRRGSADGGGDAAGGDQGASPPQHQASRSGGRAAPVPGLPPPQLASALKVSRRRRHLTQVVTPGLVTPWAPRGRAVPVGVRFERAGPARAGGVSLTLTWPCLRR